MSTSYETVAPLVLACIGVINDGLSDFDKARAAVAVRLARELDTATDKPAQVAAELRSTLDQLEAIKERADDFDAEYEALRAELSAPLVNPED